jgi:HAD superfamily hydrolase (TIGR01509 family)
VARVIHVGAVIFDLDGTLLDSEPILDRANREVLHRFGKDLTPELQTTLLGRSRADTDRILAEAAGTGVDPREVGAARAALLDGSWWRAELKPGVAEAVARIAAAGIPMAIATSSTRASATEKLRHHAELRAAMRVVVCSDHPAVREAKPAHDIFLVAAGELAVEPTACVVVEDAPSGVLAAIAAGMRVIAVPAPEVRADPAFTFAKWILESLAELDPGSC